MTEYVLVRKFRGGRQREDDTVHCIRRNDDETVCGDLTSEESRTIRNMEPVINSTVVCPVCSKKIGEIA